MYPSSSSLSTIHSITTTDGSASSSRNVTEWKEKFELYYLFGEAEKEVCSLMKDCLPRFQQVKNNQMT